MGRIATADGCLATALPAGKLGVLKSHTVVKEVCVCVCVWERE